MLCTHVITAAPRPLNTWWQGVCGGDVGTCNAYLILLTLLVFVLVALIIAYVVYRRKSTKMSFLRWLHEVYTDLDPYERRNVGKGS